MSYCIRNIQGLQYVILNPEYSKFTVCYIVPGILKFTVYHFVPGILEKLQYCNSSLSMYANSEQKFDRQFDVKEKILCLS